jgi:uncharacterized protein (DUF302 family)
MYAIKKTVKLDFNEAVDAVKEGLRDEGFGVLTEINVKDTLKIKLKVDYDDYLIIGACNPPFAYRALQAEKDIGLMLPCNVIIYRDGTETIVAAIDPVEAMSAIKNPALTVIAGEVKEKLIRAINKVK